MHEQYMKRCQDLANLAQQRGESPVGSVVVKDGRVIGEASEDSRRMRDITRHAELLAIKDAIQNVGSCEGATLYTNVEPCLLCSYAIRHYRLKEVVFARASGELGGHLGRFDLLTTEISSWPTPPTITIYHEAIGSS